MDDVPPEFRVQFPGPYDDHDVVVNGWRVPFVRAHLGDAGRAMLVLDHRFGLELTAEEAERVVPFLAHAIAIASGYEAHPSADDMPPLARTPHPKPQRVMTIAAFTQPEPSGEGPNPK